MQPMTIVLNTSKSIREPSFRILQPDGNHMSLILLLATPTAVAHLSYQRQPQGLNS